MWKRIQLAVFVILVILASGVWFAGSSQDATEVRLQALEARVSNLEATVAALNSGTSLSGATPVVETYTIEGALELWGVENDDYYMLLDSCFGTGGYDDIHVGAQVRVTDQSGALLGLGELEDDPNSDECAFVFTVEVPKSNFYTVAAGGARRQGPSYSFQEMIDNDWEVSLYIG